jgi:hypothetical protein
MWGAARRSLQLLDRSPCAIVLARRDTCRARLRLLHPRSGRPFAPGQFGAVPSRGCREGDQQAQLHQRGRPQKKPRQSAARLSDDVHRGWACRSSPRAFLPPRRRSANAPTGPFLPTPVMASGGLFALGLWPLDHVDMSAVGALKQQDRGEPVVEPGQLPGELHARPATTDQPRLWPVVHV